MNNEMIDKIVEDTMKACNFRMRLEDPCLMQQGTEELLDRIRLGMAYAANTAVGACLEEILNEKIAARKAVEVSE